MKPLVLVCDDSFAVHEGLKTFLNNANIDMISAYNGEDALRLLKSNHVDLMILDIMLPKMFGTEVLRELRRVSALPVILLSALDSEDDVVNGLALGADDYVTKPFSPREVVGRIQAILRRSGGPQDQHATRRLHYAELTVDIDAITVSVDGRQLPMSPNEVKLLAYFIENAGIVLSRERLLNAVWGYDYIGDTRTVDSQIKRIRKKLSSEGTHFQIQSVYGIGFKLEALE